MYASKPYQAQEMMRDYSLHQSRISKIIKDYRMKECRWDIQPRYPKSNRDRYNKLTKKKITEENSRLANKIISISHRKQQSLRSSTVHLPRADRKIWQQRIDEQNSLLAERLITKQSQFNRVKILKEIQEYERIKKSLMRNRKHYVTWTAHANGESVVPSNSVFLNQ